MYTSFRAMMEGWTKNLYPLVTQPGQKVTRELLSVIPWIPLACLSLAVPHPVIGVLGLLLLAGRHGSYAAMLRPESFSSLRGVLYYLGRGSALRLCPDLFGLALRARQSSLEGTRICGQGIQVYDGRPFLTARK